MIILGWLFSIGGGLGLIYTTSERDKTEYKWSNALGGDTSDIDMLYYVSIAALILGIIFLIVGYLRSIKRSNDQKSNQQKYQKSVSIDYHNPAIEADTNHVAHIIETNADDEVLFCPSCGNAFKSGDVFCSKCGKKKHTS